MRFSVFEGRLFLAKNVAGTLLCRMRGMLGVMSWSGLRAVGWWRGGENPDIRLGASWICIDEATFWRTSSTRPGLVLVDNGEVGGGHPDENLMGDSVSTGRSLSSP